MINAMTIIKKKEPLTYSDFQAYWRKEHGEIVTRSPDVGTYIQSHPIYNHELDFDNTIDGLAEIWFEDTNAMRKLAASPEYKLIQEDEKAFIDSKAVHLIIAEDIITKKGRRTDKKILVFVKKKAKIDLNVFRETTLGISFEKVPYNIIRSKISLPKLGGYKDGKSPEWDAIFTFWVKEQVNQNDIDVLKEKVSELSAVTVSKYCNSFVIQEK
jgi:uncharacterized protein (TIGR02118 family)